MNKIYIRNIWFGCVIFLAALVSCQRDSLSESIGEEKTTNLKMEFENRDQRAGSDIMNNMRIFTFFSASKLFGGELLNTEVSGNILTSPIKVGNWDAVLVSAPSGFSVGNVGSSQTAPGATLYQYSPVEASGRSSNAVELMTDYVSLPTVTTGGTISASSSLVRNVAKVQIILNEVVGDVNLSSADNRVFLHHVPSKISYSGNLQPNAVAPDTLASPIYATLALIEESGVIKNDTLSFIIPANKGDLSGTTSTHKMKLSVQLRKNDGSLFKGVVQIPLVAKCNEILRVNLKANAGVEIDASVHPWEVEDYEIEFPQTTLSVDKPIVSMGAEEFVYVNSTDPIDINVLSTASWLTVTKISETELKLQANVDTYTGSRSTSFYVESELINKLIKVTQEPQAAGGNSIDAEGFWVSPTTGNTVRTIAFNSLNNWKIVGSSDWQSKFTASATSGTSSTTALTFTRKSTSIVADYTPYGSTTITFRNLSTLEDVVINAHNLFLESGPAYVGNNPGANSNTHDDILCLGPTGRYTVMSKPTWVTSASQAALNSDLLLVSQGEETGEERSGTITIRHNDDPSYSVTFNVEQGFFISIPAFHFFVFKYTWDRSDVDIAVQFEDNSASFDNDAVGWSLGTYVYYNGERLLTWGGDATGGQGETVFFNAPIIDADSSLPRFVTIGAYATWYTSNLAPRPVTQTIYAYLNGQMVQSGTNFNNDGGELLYSEGQQVMITTTKGVQTYATGYTKVCTVTYDRIKHSARITWHAELVNTRDFINLPMPPNIVDEPKPMMEEKIIETFSR